MVLQYYAITIALAALAQGYADPGSCSGACIVSDPSVIRRVSDGTYFRFSTGDEILYASASSLAGPWTTLGSLLPDGSSIDLDGNTDLWAPDAQRINSQYYVYYAVSTFGSQDSAIGLATSDTMELDSWTDHGSIGVQSSSSKDYNAIDPNVIVVDSTGYLNFGSFWGDIFQVELKSSAKKATGTSYNIAFDSSGTHAVEGSYMYQDGDYYYLFYSAGTCCNYDTDLPSSGSEYKIKVCRSKSFTGNFVDKDGTSCTDGGGTIVLESHGTTYGPGGQGVFDDPTYGPVLYYHYINTDIGYADADKQFGWNPISFSSGWPVVQSA
ncbi:hypothetical protein N7495_009250 [Penicillium taxi]|uniref:uncharacterized protein n=1 Tax=Penicillium taxi TaxID=168475 RepID=UPI00254543A1|nr:uncharacterized protein N7495_009250 [Penicillium taxi]KAJ5884740.1 hypothetical protein N7495_009250 [Penicillium taxi]